MQQLDHLLADPAQVRAQLDQHLRRDALALADQAEQDVLGADVVVLQAPGLFLGQDDGVPGAVGESLKHENQGRQTVQLCQYHAINKVSMIAGRRITPHGLGRPAR